MENQPRQFNEGPEIDLRDYVNVLLKRKWGILAIFLIAAVVAAIISLILPQTFEATALVEIGQIKEQKLENLESINAVLFRETTLKELTSELDFLSQIPLDSVAKKFSLEEVKNSNFIKIKGRGATPEIAAKMAEAVAEILVSRHQKLFSEAEKTTGIEIETINKAQEQVTKNIAETEKNISRLKEDIKRYEQEINKRTNVNSEGQGRIAESYINLLATIKNQEESKEAQILDLEQQLNSLNQSLQQKEYEKTYQTKPTSLEAPAFPPETRISPKRKQNVMIAGVLGLFIGILWAFGAEYFSKNKLKI